MSRPHPALVDLVASGPESQPAPVRNEGAFLRSVSEHRMTSVALAAQQAGRLRLSAETATTLGMWELAERRDHLRFWATIEDVQARLRLLGAEVVVLKGVATEARWYDDLGQRACTDVDLWLAPDALDDTSAVVEALDPGRAGPEAIGWLVVRRQLQHVDLQVGEVQVDLHFDPLKLGLATSQLDAVWASTEPLVTAHGAIRVLSPEVELVQLLLHLNKDGFAFLGPFLDIAHLVQRAALDWEAVAEFVAAEGLDVPVWKSLAAVADLIDLEIAIPLVGGVRARTWDRLWGPATRLRGDEGRQRAPSVQRFLALHVSGRGGEQWRELRRQLLPPRQLLEVAGRLEPGRSYLRHVAIDHFRRSERASPAVAE